MGEAATVTVEVRVELKPGILDAEALSVGKSLALLGIDHLSAVSIARQYRLIFTGISESEALSRAQRAVDRLLANPVVHRVAIQPVPA
ncbi:MAG: phosphoribosylformylglycinamidine synthase subunit PurS [Thermoplasmata archaeon]|nr:phosphoribosylformylglycinamidine synthase subunit PurS [Thermoplasmata archaeon]